MKLVRIKPELYDRVKQLAEADSRSVTSMLNVLLEKALEDEY